jgi:localization factor PodJL
MPASHQAEPWDVDSAEALTRHFESGEGDPRRSARGDEPAPQPVRADVLWAAPAPAAEAGRDGAWLEARLADIAERLHQSVAELDPDRSLATLNGRLDQLEARFTDALRSVAQRVDVEGLRLIEAHVTDLTAYLEDARGQLARLDTIDGHVRDMAHKLEGSDRQRLESLEGQLQDYIREWRRGEESTTGVLQAIEDALGRIADRVDAIDAARTVPEPPLAAFDDLDAAAERLSLRPERDPLTQAYAAGAHALAPKRHPSSLDAADYAPPTAPQPEPDNRAPIELPLATPAPAPEERPQRDVRPSALRASLMARAASESAESAMVAPPDGTARRERAQSTTRPGLLLAAGMMLLAGGGYLVVDILMGQPAKPAQTQRGTVQTEQGAAGAKPVAVTPPAAERKATPSAPMPAVVPEKPDPEMRIDGKRDAAAPPEPAPKRPHVPETVIDDLSENTTPPRPLGSIPTPRLQPTAVVQEPEAEGTLQALQGMLPTAIGPASLRQAAAGGEPSAQFEIAARFAEGRGVGQDIGQALAWYQRAAMRGYAPAQFRLAMLYERGGGATVDPERARVWYTRAAEQGHVKAMHNLAVLYASSRADHAKAAKWFAAAAERGLVDSQFNLAVLHLNGLGVAKNRVESYKWFALATRGGDRESARWLEQVKVQLTAEEIEAGEAAAAAWRAQATEAKANETSARAIGE